MGTPRDEELAFRPRLGDRRVGLPMQRAPRFCRAVLIRAQLRFARAAGMLGPHRRARASADVAQPGAAARRCVVKARIVPVTARGQKAARLHLSYIERDGVEADGSSGRLYGPGDQIDRAALTDPLPGERHQFRLIISPEDPVALREFVRRLMAQVETDLGIRLRWGAVNHHDTAHPHAHVVVRGLDQAGHAVFIDPAYIAHRLRWQAQHLLTAELGPRLGHDIDRQLDREVGQERLTSLDRRLATLVGPEGLLDQRALGRAADSKQRGRLVGRLRLLETLQLVARVSTTGWRVADGWQESLRALGERDDIIKRLHRALGAEAAAPASGLHIIDDRGDHAAVEGVVRQKGLHDELKGDGYAIVETPAGRPVYVRLDLATLEAIPERAVVRITVERQSWRKPMDQVLAQVAAESGGIYDAAQHERVLRERPLNIGGQRVEPGAVVAANVRRLTRLERYRLVTPLGPGQWRIPADLLRTLQARETTHLRRLVRAVVVAPSLARQITWRGPSWLDERDLQTVAPGTALGGAIAARAAFLDRLGIAQVPADRRREALQELERLDLGNELGRRLGLTALAAPVAGMCGRVTVDAQGASGTRFACLIDEDNKQLVVVPLTPAVRALAGRAVTISRDETGRLRMHPTVRGRGA